jgi:hypothetical protein
MIRWFETHFGFLFVKTNRRVAYAEYLRKKYGKR